MAAHTHSPNGFGFDHVKRASTYNTWKVITAALHWIWHQRNVWNHHRSVHKTKWSDIRLSERERAICRAFALHTNAHLKIITVLRFVCYCCCGGCCCCWMHFLILMALEKLKWSLTIFNGLVSIKPYSPNVCLWIRLKCTITMKAIVCNGGSNGHTNTLGDGY